MAMNRGELETLVAEYMHREDLGANIPGFIDLATARIGRDLRSAENETVTGSGEQELITNGEFTSGLNGWSDNTISIISVVNEQMIVDRNGGPLESQCFQNTEESVEGDEYELIIDMAELTPTGSLAVVRVYGVQIGVIPLGRSTWSVISKGGSEVSINGTGTIFSVNTFNSISVKRKVFSPDAAVSLLPDNFRSMKDISYAQGARRVVLKSSSPAAMARFQETGNSPAFYRIIGRQIEIRPYQDKDFRLVYFNAPADLSAPTSENRVLTAYPQIYLYATLIEAYFFTQDAGGHGLAVETYTSEVAAENKRTENADMGDRPSIQGG